MEKGQEPKYLHSVFIIFRKTQPTPSFYEHV